MSEVVEEIKAIIEPVLSKEGYELYELEYKKEGKSWVLRIFADNQSRSITLDNCAEISNMISNILDEHETFALSTYRLEVSSPGLDRLLRNDSDFQWAMNKTLKVKYRNPKNNKKEVAEGKLKSFDTQNIELEIPKSDNLLIPRDSIESARRMMIIDEIMPKGKKK